jgi:hypothetical protein
MLGFRGPKDINELQGIWERIGDNFEGCIIKVYPEENELIGQIIVSTPTMLNAGWKIGDKKWRRIEYTQNEGWHLLDLRKQYDTQHRELLSTEYAHYWIFLNNARELQLHQSKVPLFPEQTWKKVGDLLVK